MKNCYVYLTYYQVMAFAREADQIKQKNQSFNDELLEMFTYYVCCRGYQISSLPKKIRNNIPIYKISKSLFNYLENLTSINVFDKNYMKKSIIETKEHEKEIQKRINNGEYDYLFENALKEVIKSYKR